MHPIKINVPTSDVKARDLLYPNKLMKIIGRDYLCPSLALQVWRYFMYSKRLSMFQKRWSGALYNDYRRMVVRHELAERENENY